MENTLTYKNLKRRQAGTPNIKNIKERADKICERRKRYAQVILEEIEKIKGEVAAIEHLITIIEDNCSVLESEQKEEITNICINVRESLKLYISKAQKLQNRFNNGKIRILAFGSKTQGKSTFTRLYTGLPESVVAEKGANDDLDKTGALSVISHRKDVPVETPSITVYFKTCKDILTTVNDCIVQLAVLSDCRLPNCGNKGYRSWADLHSVLSNRDKKRNAYKILSNLKDFNNKVKDFDPIRSYLKSIFEPESIFDDVSDTPKPKEISLQQLPIYNDMTNEHERRYLSVDHIEVSADLGHDDVFENFEICDSKGISAKAGAKIVEAEIYNGINNSDAAFSIQRIGQGQKAKEFYVDLSNSINSDNRESKLERLSSKHFVILNLHKGVKPESVEEVVDAINGSQLAKCIYIGSFATTGENCASFEDEVIDAKEFSILLVIDMLGKIVDSTKRSDDLLIEDCNNLINAIEKNLARLSDFLLQIQNKDEEFDIDTILLNKIEKFRDEAIKRLKERAQEENISLRDVENVENKDSISHSEYDEEYDEEDDYNDVSDDADIAAQDLTAPLPKEHLLNRSFKEDDKRDIRIFRMITASDMQDEKIKEKIKEIHNANVSDIAISYILDKEIEPLAGSNVYIGANKKDAKKVNGTASTLGGYIDSVSSLLYDKIARNINEEFAPSQNIGSITELKEAVYKTIWECFKFDILYGEFKEEFLVDNNHNTIIEKWHKLYSKSKAEAEGSAIIPEKSYNILTAYFKKVDYIPTSELLSSDEQRVLDWDLLKQSIIEVYRRYNFEGRVMEKLANEEMLKRNIFVDLTVLLWSDSFVSGIKSMYPNTPDRLLDANIITKENFEIILSKYKWENLRNAREQLVSKNITSLSEIII